MHCFVKNLEASSSLFITFFYALRLFMFHNETCLTLYSSFKVFFLDFHYHLLRLPAKSKFWVYDRIWWVNLLYTSICLLTPWNRFFVGKMTVTQLVKLFVYYGTQGFITVLTRARHLPCSYPGEFNLLLYPFGVFTLNCYYFVQIYLVFFIIWNTVILVLIHIHCLNFTDVSFVDQFDLVN